MKILIEIIVTLVVLAPFVVVTYFPEFLKSCIKRKDKSKNDEQ